MKLYAIRNKSSRNWVTKGKSSYYSYTTRSNFPGFWYRKCDVTQKLRYLTLNGRNKPEDFEVIEFNLNLDTGKLVTKTLDDYMKLPWKHVVRPMGITNKIGEVNYDVVWVAVEGAPGFSAKYFSAEEANREWKRDFKSYLRNLMILGEDIPVPNKNNTRGVPIPLRPLKDYFDPLLDLI